MGDQSQEKEKQVKRGRPQKQLPLDYEKIKTLAKFGLTDEEIAAVLGITRKTLFDRRKKDPALDEALKIGKIEADLNVIKSLYTRAISGNDTTAAIFWLKNRQPDRWRDRRDFSIEENQDQELIFKFADEAGTPEVDITDEGQSGGQGNGQEPGGGL